MKTTKRSISSEQLQSLIDLHGEKKAYAIANIACATGEDPNKIAYISPEEAATWGLKGNDHDHGEKE